MPDSICNLTAIAPMLPAESDGDTFWYTEILDRTRSSAGSNRKRLVRMFRHDCQADLIEVMPIIQALCEATGARAYIRLSPRSHKAVGKALLLLVAEMAANDAWESAAHLYLRACGRTNIHGKRLWLYDVDSGQDASGSLLKTLTINNHLVCVLPSRTGKHYITKPHNPEGEAMYGVALHKDNPTNLYIPASEGGQAVSPLEQAAYDLSTYAASINWDGSPNTAEYLEDLEKKIAAVQKLCPGLRDGPGQMSLSPHVLPSASKA